MSDHRRRRPGHLREWDSVSQAVADVYFSHEWMVLGGGDPRLVLHSLDLGPVMIGQVGWGTDVAIECDYPNSYEINIPLTGHLVSRGRYGSVVTTPEYGAVFRADSPSLIEHWDATCVVLGLKIDSDYLQAEAETVLGTDRRLTEIFPEQLSMNTGAGRGVRQILSGIATQLRTPDLFAGLEPVRHQLSSALSTALLLATESGEGSGPPAQPRMVRRVANALRDDPAHPWTVAEMAIVAGIGVRRLQECFRDCFNTTPMEYLVDVRVARARTDLLSGSVSSVSDVAARWGFSSPSRFAAAYRARYGVNPPHDRR